MVHIARRCKLKPGSLRAWCGRPLFGSRDYSEPMNVERYNLADAPVPKSDRL